MSALLPSFLSPSAVMEGYYLAIELTAWEAPLEKNACEHRPRHSL